MMGLGSTCKLTPVYSGRIKVDFQGSGRSSVTSSSNVIQLRYGTGTAPVNGAGLVGTTLGSSVNVQVQFAAEEMPFAVSGIITGLSPGTAYWFDLSVVVSSGTNTLDGVACNAMEF
jgi:hypothetical protein